jgi:gliding motility-associated-like protein
MSTYDSKVSGSSPSIAGSPTRFNVPEITILIPTGFSPNRDGQNDVFVIVRPYNITIGLEMFDRTGGIVYKSQDYKNDWDGRANQRMAFFGRDLPDGTYFYIVTATDKSTGKVTKFNGYITLRR